MINAADPGELGRLQDDCADAADLLRVLANEHRLGVMCALRCGEMSAGALVDQVGPSQSALSQHLGRLRHDGLVAARRAGRTIYYRIADPNVLELIQALAGVMARRDEGG